MLKKQTFAIMTICMFIFSSFAVLPITASEVDEITGATILTDITSRSGDGKTEYWAVLIGVDFTRRMGNIFTLPIEECVEGMYDTLLVSDHWQADHIRIVMNENATRSNIIMALRWLDKMDDGDDVCLIYYVGHGDYLHLKAKKLGIDIPIDLPPFDEKDLCDEYLTTYWTGKNPFAIITDDLFNRLLNRLDSKGVAVILDCCYSGGMSDLGNARGFFRRFFGRSLSDWMKGFSEDICKKGRVTLMACRENESAIVTGPYSLFGGGFVRKGLQGYADSNEDGMVSAEEAFAYAAPLYHNATAMYGEVVPTIDDRFPGELLLTDVDLPPSMPILSSSNGTIGQLDAVFEFNASSTDPENDSIRYGWNWRNDSIISFARNDGRVEEWSDYYSSGDVCTTPHSWVEPGVYTVRVKAQDEHGAEIIPNDYYSDLWTEPSYVIIPSNDEIVDQYQLRVYFSQRLGYGYGYAQSFTPNATSLSKIKLKLKSLHSDDWDLEYKQKYPLNVSIRSNLSGEDLVKVSKKPYTELHAGSGSVAWVEFDFPDLTVMPGDKYYIVVSCDSPYPWEVYGWAGMETEDNSDPYPRGEAYSKYEGNWDWMPETYRDYCFIAYE